MSYVKHILLPGERVMYDGRVHPTVLIPGTAILGLAVILLTLSGNTGGMHSVLLSITDYLTQYMHFLYALHVKLVNLHQRSPYIALDLKVIAFGLALWGFFKLATASILMQTTELIVTDQRIIAKTGIFAVTTVEMDRRRIAGVTVHQTVAGRIMGYGYVLIQGFTSHIGGLPPLVNPHMVERFVS